MALLIRNANVYTPDPIGVVDVLVVGEQVVALGKDLSVTLPKLEVLDAKGKILTPGFIDLHQHVTGGGGEGGPVSRPPEVMLSELVACGTTSVVGTCGTDRTTRSVPNLLAKVRALKTEGISAWMYTSNYTYPPTLMTDCVQSDLFFVPECLGVKIAMGDHRCSFPTMDELMRLLSQIRVGGMIAGKMGVLHIHMGDIDGPFEMFAEAVRRGIPIQHIRPTHVARKKNVFDNAIEFGRAGGYIDITSEFSFVAESAAAAVVQAIEAGVPLDRITLSTDGHGSMPRFNEKGEMVGLGVCGVAGNLRDIQRLIRDFHQKPETVLPFVTRNVATSLELTGKGIVAEGASGDFCLFDENFELCDVIARGRVMMRSGEILVKGTFEY